MEEHLLVPSGGDEVRDCVSRGWVMTKSCTMSDTSGYCQFDIGLKSS